MKCTKSSLSVVLSMNFIFVLADRICQGSAECPQHCCQEHPFCTLLLELNPPAASAKTMNFGFSSSSSKSNLSPAGTSAQGRPAAPSGLSRAISLPAEIQTMSCPLQIYANSRSHQTPPSLSCNLPPNLIIIPPAMKHSHAGRMLPC